MRGEEDGLIDVGQYSDSGRAVVAEVGETDNVNRRAAIAGNFMVFDGGLCLWFALGVILG